jgi:putative DNA primase/helicase
VKELTANERIAARKNYGDVFEFPPTHKFLLLTNHRPFVKGTDDGIWRRLNFIGFNAKIAEQDKDLAFRENKLVPEMEGVLAWMVKGCLKWQRDGLKPSDSVRQSLNEYRSEMDFVAQWLEERSEKDPTATISRSEAYSNFREWAQAAHFPVIGNRRFVEELHSRGFGMKKIQGIRLFSGLKLRRPTGFLHVVSGGVVGG